MWFLNQFSLPNFFAHISARWSLAGRLFPMRSDVDVISSKVQGQIDDNHIQFRQAGPQDIDILAEFRWQLCTEESQNIDSVSKAEFIADFKVELPAIEASQGLIHLFAEGQQDIVAVLSIVLIVKLPAPVQEKTVWGYLTNVYTLPEYRNKGIGNSLLSHAKHWAKQQNLELLVVIKAILFTKDPAFTVSVEKRIR
jgi:GNAT superfamily N-acetyltransferase